ncbi:hypothetical protein DW241_04975 [Hungatella hathewayi]|nr:hypothetical protein DW241_04975 [Hungatella hathewayi]
MERTIYVHNLYVKKKRGKKVKEIKSMQEDLLELISKLLSQDKKLRKQTYDYKKQILYLNKSSYKKEDNILVLQFISAKYAMVRNVLDTETLDDKGQLKTKKDGDEEKTHIGIKFTGKHSAICLYENNPNGISFSIIMNYLNDFILEQHKLRQDNYYYKIEHNNKVSKDFLKALKYADRIKAVTLTVDQEDLKVSEIKRFSGKNDIKRDIDILLKPAARGKSITKNTVKDFFNIFEDEKSDIKKIYVDADKQDKTPLKFDTEQMKERENVNVLETVTGEADPNDIKKILFGLLKEY